MLSVTKAVGSDSGTTLFDNFNGLWEDTASALEVDGQLTVASDVGDTDGTDDLWVIGYGFAIPDNATIKGVTVTVRHQGVPNPGSSVTLYLQCSGARIGTLRDRANVPTTSLATHEFGGSDDLWGAALTPAIVNDATFGVNYRCAVQAANDAIYVDGFTITVSYTLPNFVPIIVRVIRRFWK